MSLGELIDLLQKRNDNSPSQHWEIPSKWLRDWTSKMKIIAADCKEILMQVEQIDHENDVVSLNENWGSPSNYLKDRIKEMRDRYVFKLNNNIQCLSGF